MSEIQNGNYYITWPRAVGVGIGIIVPILGAMAFIYLSLMNSIEESRTRSKLDRTELKQELKESINGVNTRLEKLEDNIYILPDRQK